MYYWCTFSGVIISWFPYLYLYNKFNLNAFIFFYYELHDWRRVIINVRVAFTTAITTATTTIKLRAINSFYLNSQPVFSCIELRSFISASLIQNPTETYICHKEKL